MREKLMSEPFLSHSRTYIAHSLAQPPKVAFLLSERFA